MLEAILMILIFVLIDCCLMSVMICTSEKRNKENVLEMEDIRDDIETMMEQMANSNRELKRELMRNGNTNCDLLDNKLEEIKDIMQRKNENEDEDEEEEE